ncbi:hypothetical protein VTN00DRAFT_10254 [Thermoascus crustaceus]|uniref:uncharacterized protein n=1 Tax=Thermoascus crustaceus TaxID=5088 RepID=UPI003742D411
MVLIKTLISLGMLSMWAAPTIAVAMREPQGGVEFYDTYDAVPEEFDELQNVFASRDAVDIALEMVTATARAVHAITTSAEATRALYVTVKEGDWRSNRCI